MKATGGKANPAAVNDILKAKLGPEPYLEMTTYQLQAS
jgi:hypothetical protein